MSEARQQRAVAFWAVCCTPGSELSLRGNSAAESSVDAGLLCDGPAGLRSVIFGEPRVQKSSRPTNEREFSKERSAVRAEISEARRGKRDAQWGSCAPGCQSDLVAWSRLRRSVHELPRYLAAAMAATGLQQDQQQQRQLPLPQGLQPRAQQHGQLPT